MHGMHHHHRGFETHHHLPGFIADGFPGPEGHGPGPHHRHHHGFGGGFRGPRHSGRARRGQLRESVLKLLAEQPLNGYQLMMTLSEKTLGAWQPSPGAIYPCLSQLEDEGLITASQAEGQKVFSLTEAGRAAAEPIGDEPWSGAGKPGFAGHKALFEQFHSLALTVRFAGQTASSDQVTAIAEQLESSRKAILAIMAEAQ